MLKFILISIMFLICTFIGFYLGEKYRQRTLNLKEMQKALMILNSEILYANTPLPEALLDISKKVSDPISKILAKTSKNLELGEVLSVNDAFDDAFNTYKEEVALTKDDYKLISDFFKSIGECGIVGQERIFKLALEGLNINYLEANSEAKTNIKIYRALGASIGAMMGIFFI